MYQGLALSEWTTDDRVEEHGPRTIMARGLVGAAAFISVLVTQWTHDHPYRNRLPTTPLSEILEDQPVSRHTSYKWTYVLNPGWTVGFQLIDIPSCFRHSLHVAGPRAPAVKKQFPEPECVRISTIYYWFTENSFRER